jgi:hypothetical protein
VSALPAAVLARQLEDGTLDGAAFRHAEHVRLGRWYVQRYGLATALARFSQSVRRFAESHGSSKYHETITWAFLLLIAERVQEASPDQTWDEFARDNADLLEFPGILTRLYHQETLHSARAKTHFVLPDRLERTVR